MSAVFRMELRPRRIHVCVIEPDSSSRIRSLSGVLRHVKYKGGPLVKDKHLTGFSDGEEEEVKLTHVVPFLVEDELLRLGAIFEKKANWQPFAITDGRLITGRNPLHRPLQPRLTCRKGRPAPAQLSHSRAAGLPSLGIRNSRVCWNFRRRATFRSGGHAGLGCAIPA
jgi:hypothetical protein